MKVKILVTALFGLFSLAAYAGLHQPAALVIDLDNQFAQGDMLTAANSVNSDEFIGCGIRSWDGYRYGFCQAGDDDGTTVACFTESDTLMDAIQGIADHSFITFSWGDVGLFDEFTCTRVGFSTQSFYIVKVKN